MIEPGCLHPSPIAAQEPGPQSLSWRRFRFLLAGLVLCRGVVLLCVLPPFEAWDEYQHVAYVQHIAENGTAPRLGATTISPSLLAKVVEFPQPRLALPGQLDRLGARGYLDFWEQPGTDRRPAERPRPDVPVSLYQAQHASFYYHLAAPLYETLGGRSNLRASVAGLRSLNLLLLVGAVWITLGAVRASVRRERDAALIGLALAAHPLFLMNGVRVANDGLGILLAAASVASCLALRTHSTGRSLAVRCLAAGVLTGLAILAKATNFALIPFALFCTLGLAAQGASRRRALMSCMAMGTGIVAVILPEVGSNLANFGSLTPMQEGLVNRAAGRSAGDLLRAAAALDWTSWFQRLWDRESLFVGGWSFRPAGYLETLAYRQLIAASILGWLWVLATRRLRHGGRSTTFRSGWTPLAALLLVLSYSLALAYHRTQSQLAWGLAVTCPWYASPALPWFLTLVVGGALGWPWRKRVGPVLAFGLVAVMVATEVIGIFGRMIPCYTAFAPWPIAIQRLAWGQPACLGTPTLVLALMAEFAMLVLLVLTWRDAAKQDPHATDSLADGASIRLDRVRGIARIAPRVHLLGRGQRTRREESSRPGRSAGPRDPAREA